MEPDYSPRRLRKTDARVGEQIETARQATLRIALPLLALFLVAMLMLIGITRIRDSLAPGDLVAAYAVVMALFLMSTFGMLTIPLPSRKKLLSTATLESKDELLTLRVHAWISRISGVLSAILLGFGVLSGFVIEGGNLLIAKPAGAAIFGVLSTILVILALALAGTKRRDQISADGVRSSMHRYWHKDEVRVGNVTGIRLRVHENRDIWLDFRGDIDRIKRPWFDRQPIPEALSVRLYWNSNIDIPEQIIRIQELMRIMVEPAPDIEAPSTPTTQRPS